MPSASDGLDGANGREDLIAVDGRTYRRHSNADRRRLHRRLRPRLPRGCVRALAVPAHRRAHPAGRARRGALADAELHEPQQRLDRDRPAAAGHGIWAMPSSATTARAPAHRSGLPAAETIPNAFTRPGVPRARRDGEGQAAAPAGRARRPLRVGREGRAARRRRPARRCPSSSSGPCRASTSWDCSPYALELALVLAQRLGSDAHLRLADRLRAALARAGLARQRRVSRLVDQLVGRATSTRASTSASWPTTACTTRRPPTAPPTCAISPTSSMPRCAARISSCRSPTPTSSTTPRSGSCAWVHLAVPERRPGARARCGAPGRGGGPRPRARCAPAGAPRRSHRRPRRARRPLDGVFGGREGEHDLSALAGDARVRTAAGTSRPCPCCSRCRCGAAAAGERNADVLYDLLLNA